MLSEDAAGIMLLLTFFNMKVMFVTEGASVVSSRHTMGTMVVATSCARNVMLSETRPGQT